MDIKHFLQFKDLTLDELEHLFERTRIIKQRFKATSHTIRWQTARW